MKYWDYNYTRTLHVDIVTTVTRDYNYTCMLQFTILCGYCYNNNMCISQKGLRNNCNTVTVLQERLYITAISFSETIVTRV